MLFRLDRQFLTANSMCWSLYAQTRVETPLYGPIDLRRCAGLNPQAWYGTIPAIIKSFDFRAFDAFWCPLWKRPKNFRNSRTSSGGTDTTPNHPGSFCLVQGRVRKKFLYPVSRFSIGVSGLQKCACQKIGPSAVCIVAGRGHKNSKIFKTTPNHLFSIRAFKSPEKAGFLDIWVGGVSGTGWCPKMLKSAQKCIFTYSQNDAL